jgi:hypothetical protein
MHHHVRASALLRLFDRLLSQRHRHEYPARRLSGVRELIS